MWSLQTSWGGATGAAGDINSRVKHKSGKRRYRRRYRRHKQRHM